MISSISSGHSTRVLVADSEKTLPVRVRSEMLELLDIDIGGVIGVLCEVLRSEVESERYMAYRNMKVIPEPEDLGLC